MNFQEVKSLCPQEWHSWLLPTPASNSPALVGQRTLVLSPGVGLAPEELAATRGVGCHHSTLMWGFLSPQIQTGA